MDRKRNKIIRILLLLIFISLLTSLSSATVKKSDLAGKWYSSNPSVLKRELESYLKKAKVQPIEGEVLAVIAPHAGFRFSGPIAAYSYKVLSGKKIKTVIVVGFSHRTWYDYIAVLDEEGFQTPLGIVEIDRFLTKELMGQNKKIQGNSLPFSQENSIEMEIPFLQVAFKDFKIVLLAIGNQSLENSKVLGNALYKTLKNKKDYVIVASTDMCHYLGYNEANHLDKRTIEALKEFDPEKLYEISEAKNHELMCGIGAVTATMIAAKKLGGNEIKILKYANSGDTSGDKSRVVGYLSAAFVKSSLRNTQCVRGTRKEGEGMLSKEQKDKLLRLARDSITYYLKNGKKIKVKEEDLILNKEMGAFVTLHKHGDLRGCIGNMVGRGPLYMTVRDMAVEAATGDPRFPKVTLGEMDEIDIEISALSPMEKIDNPETIEVGKHGVMVRRGFQGGVYLPQVATETGWTREEFMNSLCGQKAGIPYDAWKKGNCDIYVFTAEVFGEKE